jgi:hypothetical protein
MKSNLISANDITSEKVDSEKVSDRDEDSFFFLEWANYYIYQKIINFSKSSPSNSSEAIWLLERIRFDFNYRYHYLSLA